MLTAYSDMKPIHQSSNSYTVTRVNDLSWFLFRYVIILCIQRKHVLVTCDAVQIIK